MRRGEGVCEGTLLAGCCFGLMLAVPSGAVCARPTLTLRNLRAEVEVIPEDRNDITVAVDMHGSDDPAPVVTTHADKATVEGGIETGVRAVRYSLNLQQRLDVAAAKLRSNTVKAHVDPLARIIVHTPRNLDIRSNSYAFGHVGPSHSLTIHDNGDGEWTIDDVEQDVDVEGQGDSNYHLANAALASIGMMGHGNLGCGRVRRLLLGIYGSGDVSVGTVQGEAEVVIGGIGDFTARSVSGKMLIEMEDAGSVRVLDGQLSQLKVRTLDGLGTIDVGGTVQDADVSIGTRTAVHLHRVTGTLRKKLRQAARLDIDGP